MSLSPSPTFRRAAVLHLMRRVTFRQHSEPLFIGGKCPHLSSHQGNCDPSLWSTEESRGLELVRPGLTKPPLLSLARRSNKQLSQDELMRLCPTWLSHLSWMSLFYFRTAGPGTLNVLLWTTSVSGVSLFASVLLSRLTDARFGLYWWYNCNYNLSAAGPVRAAMKHCAGPTNNLCLSFQPAFVDDPFSRKSDTPALPPKKSVPPRPKPPSGEKFTTQSVILVKSPISICLHYW